MSLNKTVPLWPLVLAVFLTVAYKLGDSYVINHLIPSPDLLLVTLVYLTIGAIVGLVINYLLCQTPLGRLVDRSYTSIHGMSKKAQVTAFVSGAFSAIATGIYLWSMTTLDPSIVIPLTSLTVLYIAFAESVAGRVKFGKVLPSILLVVGGLVLATFNFANAANWFSIGRTLFTVLFGYNMANAVSEYVSKDGVDASDAVSFGFWRFFWLTVSAVLIAIGTSLGLGLFGSYLALLMASTKAIPFIILVMVVVFFANAWANRGLALSNATTKNLVLSGQVVLSVFVTFFISLILPGIFPALPATLIQWLFRFVGSVLLMWGIVRLRE